LHEVKKIGTFILLAIIFLVYTGFVYTSGTSCTAVVMNAEAVEGKLVFQKYNCTACHQLYGLGGYLGPDLTTTLSQPGKNEHYIKAILKTGTKRMPNHHLSDKEINSLIAFLNYTNETATTLKMNSE